MTWTSSMSSGYSSLEEEESEEFFFTARTSFFRRPPGKTRTASQVSAARRVERRPRPAGQLPPVRSGPFRAASLRLASASTCPPPPPPRGQTRGRRPGPGPERGAGGGEGLPSLAFERGSHWAGLWRGPRRGVPLGSRPEGARLRV